MLIALAYLMLGFADVRADVNTPGSVRSLMDIMVRASVHRHAPAVAPVAPSDSVLFAGGHIYLEGCAGCHGTPGRPRRDSSGFLPPPYLPGRPSRYSEAEIAWIVRHGIRRTGMSAYGPFLKDNQVAVLAAFLARFDSIPPAVLDSLLKK